MATKNPKLFISYSWTSPDHEAWVIDLATSLREDGVDVILDKWDLKEGHDAYKFMEQMVSDPDVGKVVMVCNREYAEKANERSGGVGTETQIISAEIYAKADQDKFVAVAAERDDNGRPFVPVYYQSRIYVDLSDNDLYAKNYDQLVRWVYDSPLHIKPPLGQQPGFLSDSASSKLGTSASFRRALEAIRTQKPYRLGALRDYLDRFARGIETLRLDRGQGVFDDKVFASIEEFLPYRNEVLEVFFALSQYENTPETHRALHRFFEQLLPYLERPQHVTCWNDGDFDNFRFIVHELFLYAIVALLKYERFDGVAYLLRHRYYVGAGPSTSDAMVPFSTFWRHLGSLHDRNQRLGLRRLDPQGDLLEERAKVSGVPFYQVMQADFTLHVRDCLNSLREGRNQEWGTPTLRSVRSSQSFEIYARAESKQYFEVMKQVLDINAKQDLRPLFDAYNSGRLHIPRWGLGFTLNPERLLGYAEMATRP
jgi:hypothetical protein